MRSAIPAFSIIRSSLPNFSKKIMSPTVRGLGKPRHAFCSRPLTGTSPCRILLTAANLRSCIKFCFHKVMLRRDSVSLRRLSTLFGRVSPHKCPLRTRSSRMWINVTSCYVFFPVTLLALNFGKRDLCHHGDSGVYAFTSCKIRRF